jgi:exonuclease V gamma subunit
MDPRDVGQPLADSASSTIVSQDNLWNDGKLGGSHRRTLELAACIDEREVETFDEVEEDSMLVIVDARILHGEGHSMQPTIARLHARFVEEVLKYSVPDKYDD